MEAGFAPPELINAEPTDDAVNAASPNDAPELIF
jgi:hypothetical protein